MTWLRRANLYQLVKTRGIIMTKEELLEKQRLKDRFNAISEKDGFDYDTLEKLK